MTEPAWIQLGRSATRPVCLVLVTLACGAIAGAQSPTFSSRVNSVRVDVLVTDRGQPVLGLEAGDFEIQDNGVLQTVELITFEQAPLNVVLVFDVSGSLTDERLAQFRHAGRALVDGLRPLDRAGLVTFNSVVTVAASLSHDVAPVRKGLELAAPSSDTALVDASYAAMLLAESAEGRGLAIVFSDGADTASFLHPDAVLATAKRMDAVVYAVSAPGSPDDTFLPDLTNVTGGRVLRPNMSNLGETFLTILSEFRQRYLVSYTPRGVSAAGWHQLTVRLKSKRGAVRARRGYVAGPG